MTVGKFRQWVALSTWPWQCLIGPPHWLQGHVTYDWLDIYVTCLHLESVELWNSRCPRRVIQAVNMERVNADVCSLPYKIQLNYVAEAVIYPMCESHRRSIQPSRRYLSISPSSLFLLHNHPPVVAAAFRDIDSSWSHGDCSNSCVSHHGVIW